MPAGMRYAALLRPWARPYHQGGSTCRPRPTVPALMAPGHTVAALGTCGIGWLGLAAFDRLRSTRMADAAGTRYCRAAASHPLRPRARGPRRQLGGWLATKDMRQVSTATRRSGSTPRMTSVVLRPKLCVGDALGVKNGVLKKVLESAPPMRPPFDKQRSCGSSGLDPRFFTAPAVDHPKRRRSSSRHVLHRDCSSSRSGTAL